MRRKIFIFMVTMIWAPQVYADPVRPLFNCYFEKDEKYQEYPTGHSKTELAAWKQEKLRSVLKEGYGPGVLEHNEGGPHGAHWNSNANLFCIALFPNGTQGIQRKNLFLNNVEAGVRFETQPTSLTWSIAGSRWVRLLRKARPSDCPPLLSTVTHAPLTCEEIIAVGKVVAVRLDVTATGRPLLSETRILHRETGE